MRAILDARLLDLSMTGARITHRTPLCPEVPYTLELPPSPGGLVLPIQVIRSTVGGTEHRPAGQRLARYESALAFVGVTAEQQATLARVLEQHPRGRWHPQATGGLRVLAPASRGTARRGVQADPPEAARLQGVRGGLHRAAEQCGPQAWYNLVARGSRSEGKGATMYRARFSVLGILILETLALAGCGSQLSQRVEESRAALEMARAAGAPARSPRQFEVAEEALKRSEALMGNPFGFSEAQYQVALGKAMALCSAATAKLQVEVEKAQAGALATRAQAERFQIQAQAAVDRLQARLRTTEETAGAAQARAERAEAQLAELKQQAVDASRSQPTAYPRYVVKKGDTLPNIAARPEVYGDATQWKRIYEANQDIIGRDYKVRPGQVLMIPKP